MILRPDRPAIVRLGTGLVLGLALSCLATSSLDAQSARVKVSGAQFAGVPVDISIDLRGFAPDPEPTVEAPTLASGQLTALGITTSGHSISIRNGVRSIQSQLTLRYRFLAQEPGRYRIGPFVVSQNGETANTRTITIRLQKVPVSDKLRLKLVLPEKPVFVGQRVPIAVEWWILEREREAFLDHHLSYDFSVPLFSRPDAFTFIDEEVSRGDNNLSFVTSTADVAVKIEIERRTHDGDSFLVLVAKRTLVPLKPGAYDLAPATVTADEVLGWVREGRGFFQQRRARTTKVLARDLARKLVVERLPVRGRPPSFAGAVGRGFSLEVSADRTVVQVGDPITLTLTLRGDGNLDSSSLPPLSAGDNLPAAQFRVPKRLATGVLGEDGSKIFTVKVRVQDAAVDAIPGIAYSWFDTTKGKYETTHSRPIALAVRAGHMVTAADAIGTEIESSSDSPTAAPVVRAQSTGRSTFTLIGADLSISTAQIALADPGRKLGGDPARAALYGSSLLILALAWLSRRSADVDPAVVRRRRRLTVARKNIDGADRLPRKQGLEQVAAALREMLAEMPGARSTEIDQFLAECEAIIYEPGADPESPIDANLVARAKVLAATILERAS